jgi:hypothetical protein
LRHLDLSDLGLNHSCKVQLAIAVTLALNFRADQDVDVDLLELLLEILREWLDVYLQELDLFLESKDQNENVPSCKGSECEPREAESKLLHSFSTIGTSLSTIGEEGDVDDFVLFVTDLEGTLNFGDVVIRTDLENG